jgi:hypothetical protein
VNWANLSVRVRATVVVHCQASLCISRLLAGSQSTGAEKMGCGSSTVRVRTPPTAASPAQREEDERKKREDEERKRREDEEERKKREEEQRKTREEEERKKREEQERKNREEEKRERETHIAAGEAAVAFARKRLGNGDIEEAKAARAKAAFEYGQAKEDRTSEIAVRIFVKTFQNTKGHIYIYIRACILVLASLAVCIAMVLGI